MMHPDIREYVHRPLLNPVDGSPGCRIEQASLRGLSSEAVIGETVMARAATRHVSMIIDVPHGDMRECI